MRGFIGMNDLEQCIIEEYNKLNKKQEVIQIRGVFEHILIQRVFNRNRHVAGINYSTIRETCRSLSERGLI